ncbi:carboxylesterase/lipase family protein [Arthrobacter sp. AQ5-06]|nr:carboxylesterase/lipase family protein [Arthrobacter sp. AQ5-06]
MTSQTIEIPTALGTVRGSLRGESASFLGIPYAQPPVGERRFAAPVPFGPWEGVLDATEHGATPQRTALAEVTLIPEPTVPGPSTLNLNVFAPVDADFGSKLPVLVWIHGGGFVAGSPASPWYDGAGFNRDGVVTVSISYRLGFDGFGWIEDAPHNRGILDWMLALQWVQDHIASFGGDPSRVTIAGQSAGGGAVLTLLATKGAEKLFARGYSISGAAADIPLEKAEAAGRELAGKAGVEPNIAGFSSLREEQILSLQGGVGLEADPDASDPMAPMVALVTGGLTFGPVIDGQLLTDTVENLLRNGAGADKPLVLGSTDHEFNMAMAQHEAPLAGVDPVPLLSRFGASPELIEEYRAQHAGLSTAGLLGQFITDSMFRVKTLQYAQARDEAGAPAFLYRFSWQSPTIGGACHCLDVPFFFDCLADSHVAHIAGPNPPQELADELHSEAVGLIVNGAPGWGAYTADSPMVRVYNTPSTTADNGYSDVALLQPAATPAN